MTCCLLKVRTADVNRFLKTRMGENMMKCPVCGYEMSDDDMFCPKCGFNPDLDFDDDIE